MATNDIKTSHDLAEALEDAAKALRAVPNLSLYELGQILAEGKAQRSNVKASAGKAKFDLSDLAARLPNLERDEAESELNALNVDSLRQLATLLGIRIRSKMPKSQSVALLLAQLFDIPAGQELIRTFHRRNSHP